MILVLGSVVAREGHIAEALALSQAHVARSRTEPGCVARAVHQDSENPLRLVFVERWASMEALRAHFNIPASRGFAKALAGLASAPPEIALYEANPIGMPGRNAP